MKQKAIVWKLRMKLYYSCPSVKIKPKLLTNFCITIDQMEGMEIGYLCEVLHYLLRERLGTTLVRISVDLVDKDNEASFDLLCALFKHCKSYIATCIGIGVSPAGPVMVGPLFWQCNEIHYRYI